MASALREFDLESPRLLTRTNRLPQVNKNREITKKIIEHAESRGCKGLFITVDAPQLGRREKDMRSKFSDVGSNVQNTGGDNVDRSQGAARAISSFIDPSLSWKDIPWFKSVTKMPILLKGVQRVEDVIRAVAAGVDGVVLSNHGGNFALDQYRCAQL